MKRRSIIYLLALATLAVLTPLQSIQAGWDPREEPADTRDNTGNRSVDEAIANLKRKDPGIKLFFQKAYGYAIFPTVGKAGIGIGGAYGEGEVYRQGRYIGSSSLSQLTIGFQLGGQAYTEIIFFKDKHALEDFTSGNFEFNAQASAVAVTAGASADADYDNGVAIFTLPKGGLMYEASVGGQKFSFEPAR
ncbi:MAG: YSC84-related protein [Sedimenticola sp.]|nr:YSC84-related protein [Sedimenticola sp.]